MSQQVQLGLLGEDHRVGLTPRQDFALDVVIRAHGIDAVELGAEMHARRGRHDVDNICSFCQREGLGVLRELKRKKLVVRRRKRENKWFALGHETPAATPPPPGYGVLPEGY